MGTLLDPLHQALLLDGLRLAHLAAIAAGLGCVIVTDLTMLRWLGVPIGHRQGTALEAAHAIIGPALMAAWITGLALVAARTGFDPAAFSPKLLAKLGVVTLLSLNVILILRYVQPVIVDYRGTGLLYIPFHHKLLFALSGALSVAGWGAALLLGGSHVVKPLGWDVLLPLLSAIYIATMVVTVSFALAAHLRLWLRQRRTPHDRPYLYA
ncbi:MAG: hypothetical protein AAFT19_03265 [Pseudomonadota bacterium]